MVIRALKFIVDFLTLYTGASRFRWETDGLGFHVTWSSTCSAIHIRTEYLKNGMNRSRGGSRIFPRGTSFLGRKLQKEQSRVAQVEWAIFFSHFKHLVQHQKLIKIVLCKAKKKLRQNPKNAQFWGSRNLGYGDGPGPYGALDLRLQKSWGKYSVYSIH